MVEGDVFWSYGLGASFALAAFRQLREIDSEKPEDLKMELNRGQLRRLKSLLREIEDGDGAFTNQYFVKMLLFLSVLFVPSVTNMLWSNPSWETAHLGSYETMPGWLVGGISATNVTQAILGFWVTRNLIARGEYYKAAQQTIYGYFAFWFLLVNGWDKAGYRRFLSRDRESFENWRPGNALDWLRSDVVRILLAYGTVFVPLMMFWMTKWLKEGYEMDPRVDWPEDTSEQIAEITKLGARIAWMLLGWTLGLAACSNLLIRKLGWALGGSLAAGFTWLAGTGRWGLGPRDVRKILRVDSLVAHAIGDATLN